MAKVVDAQPTVSADRHAPQQEPVSRRAAQRRRQPTHRPIPARHLGGAAGAAGRERPWRNRSARSGPPRPSTLKADNGPGPNAATTPPPSTSSAEQAAWDELQAALAARASFSGHAQSGGTWPDGAGMPDPQPQAFYQPTRLLSRPHGRRLILSGRLRWLCRLPLVICWHATVSTVPRFQGQGRPPGQAIQEGCTYDRGKRELCRQPDRRPRVAAHRGRGIARAMFRVAVSGRREQEASFFTVIVWRDQA